MDYFEILNTLGDGVLCVDQQLNIVYANRKAMQLLNVSIDELLLKPVDKWFDVMSKDGPIIRGIICGVFETGIQSGLCKNAYIMTPYGIAMYISASVSRVSKDGGAHTVVINFREVSEMVMHEKKVSHSKENLQHVINKLPYGLVFLDQDNYVESCNEYIEKNFQTQLSQGEKIGDLLRCKNSVSRCGGSSACHQCLLSSTLDNRKPFNQIIQCRMSHIIDNKLIEDDYELNIVSFRENRLDKSFVVIRNVTTENSFRRELVSSRLQESVKVQLQDVFYTYVSDELVDLVEDLIHPLERITDYPNDLQSRHLKETKHKSKIIKKEVEGIKHFRSLEQVNDKVIRSYFYVSDLVKENIDLFKNLYDGKGIQISTDLSSLINTEIYQDKEKLSFVIRQLLKNVSCLIKQGSINLKAYIHGDSLVIKMISSGQFSKCNGFSSKSNEETSILCDGNSPQSSSLILVKEIVDLLNGHIRYKLNEEGVQSITVLLPLESPQVEIDATKNNKVLVMEDDLVQQIIISKMLESMGYEVTMTDNGEDGLKSFLMNAYKTTLVDIQMPKKNGYEVIYEIKRLKPKERVIAMSTLSSRGQREEIMKAGFDMFLSKPIKYDSLRTCLEDKTENELTYFRFDDAYSSLKNAVRLKETIMVNDLIEDLRLKSQDEHIHHLLFKAKIAYRKGKMDDALEYVEHAYEMEKKDASTYSRR